MPVNGGGKSLSATDDRVASPLDPAARSSITALARALEVFDPPAAHRAALRASLVDRLSIAAGVPVAERVDAIGAAILAEVSIVFTHVRPVGTSDVVPDPASAVLSASVLGRLPGMAGIARAIRHQYERWDGSGGPHGLRGPDIPLSSRLLTLAATLVGHPQHGQAPNWTARKRRVDELIGTAIDPDLGAAAHLELESGPPIDSDVTLDSVLSSLDRFVAETHGSPVEALIGIGAAVRAVGQIPSVLKVIGEQALLAVNASNVSIGRIGEGGNHVHILVNVGEFAYDAETHPADEQYTNVERPGIDLIVAGEGYLRSVDEGRSDDPTSSSLHSRGLRSEAAWPIKIGNDVWGFVIATTLADQRNLDHDDLLTLRLVATHIAAAVVQAERFAEFEELAFTDPLTGLGNRRVLEHRLLDIFERPSVDRQDVALIMCDVDGLKVINDTLGHSAGDQLLVAAGESLKTAADSVANSTVCRIGGDEFCVVLDGGGMLSSHPVMDMALDLFQRSGPNRSMSCGVALATDEVQSPNELLRRADVAQYEQKRIRKGLPPVSQLHSDHDRRRTRRDP